MEDAHYHQFKDKLNTKVKSLLDPGDHLKLDMSPFLDEDDTQIHQSLIGSMQWAITIGRCDINTAVMTISSFPEQPLRVTRMYGYLIKFRYLKIRFFTDEPNYDDVPMIEHNWSNTLYGNDKGILPDNAPKYKEKCVVLSH